MDTVLGECTEARVCSLESDCSMSRAPSGKPIKHPMVGEARRVKKETYNPTALVMVSAI